MLSFDALFLIPLLPLIGALINGLLGRRLDRGLVTIVALSTVLGAFAITLIAAITMLDKGLPLEDRLWTWMQVGRFTVDLTFGLDALSATLMLVVTGVGFLIHVYSVGYMQDDPSYARYFAYLNLFIFAMSVLVLGRSLPVMFVGWEGVGLASYLLIGFWYADEAKAKAGRKAFVVNRIGDFGFLIGIFTLFGLFGSADFVELQKASAEGIKNIDEVLRTGIFAGHTVGGVITFACLALFVGACGKSAQLPLYVWLPDAMAGPTPVSALIHAATMVTAGVYMVCRLHFLYELSPAAMDVVAWTGAATAVFAASIGLVQNDIKKVLAYSTVSQLGYMFLAAGVGAYTGAVFHLVTHAFFKACLFLGSGAVIHALHGEQDIQRMGGLAKLLPKVYWPFLVSTLAIAGIPPLSGFFSKDAILAFAFAHDPALGVMGMVGAVMTAFYMARMTTLTFAGKLRHPDSHLATHLHLPGPEMWMPLMILGTLAVVAGVLNLPHITGFQGILDHALQPVVGAKEVELAANTELGLMALSAGVALLGLWVGYALYKNGPTEGLERATREGPTAAVYRLLYNKWYVDELYQLLIVRPIRFIGSVCAAAIDPFLIDGVIVKVLPFTLVQVAGWGFRRPQNGNVQTYATVFVLVAAAITVWALYSF
jgi:NADH-quinone oxidoreductase subunit L